MNSTEAQANMKSRILIVDDHPVVRWGMSQMVNQEADLHICCEAGDETEALHALANCRHDLAIVDLSLAGVSGLSLIKSIKAGAPELPILVMSMHDESVYAARVMRAGARGYIMKHEAPDNVLRAIRQTLAGHMYLSDTMRTKLLTQMFDGRGNAGASPVEKLSDTELEIFKLVGKGLSTREIAELLSRSVKTVETHRRNIIEKLQLKTSLELVRFAARWSEQS